MLNILSIFLDNVQEKQGYAPAMIILITLVAFYGIVGAAFLILIAHLCMHFPLLTIITILAPAAIVVIRQYFIMRKNKND